VPFKKRMDLVRFPVIDASEQHFTEQQLLNAIVANASLDKAVDVPFGIAIGFEQTFYRRRALALDGSVQHLHALAVGNAGVVAEVLHSDRVAAPGNFNKAVEQPAFPDIDGGNHVRPLILVCQPAGSRAVLVPHEDVRSTLQKLRDAGDVPRFSRFMQSAPALVATRIDIHRAVARLSAQCDGIGLRLINQDAIGVASVRHRRSEACCAG